MIDLSAPFSTFRISSSRAFYTFLPVQLYMIPAGQATPACTDLIDLSRLRVNYSRGNFRGTEFRFGTLQESLVPVLRIQVDLKCTGNFIFTSLVDGGRHADLIFGPPAGV